MKQLFRKKFSWLFTLAIAMLVVVPFAAFADDIQNDLGGTAGVMSLITGGATGSTQLTVIPQNGDGKSGCNLTASKTLVVTVASSNAAVATVSPSELTFGSCGDVRTVTVTPVSAGSASVSLTETSNTTAGSFNLAPGAFTVNVAPPPNTPPSVVVTGVVHGAEYAKGSVPAAGCQVTDAEDHLSNSPFPASLSAITGDYSVDGLGNQTATCSWTDSGGLPQTVFATYSIYDPSAPIIGYTLNPAGPDGANDWYKSDVTLTWTVSEPQSPNSLVKTGCVDQSITTDQAATTYSCSATSAGGSAAEVSVSIKRDATAPSITASAKKADTSAYTAGSWTNQDVTVHFACTDSGSGVGSATADQTISAEGETASVNGTCTDAAGNSSNASFGPIKIDTTAPSVSCDSADGLWHAGNVSIACTATDGGSGLALADQSFSLSTSVAAGTEDPNASTGTHNVADAVGNSATAGPIGGNKVDRKGPGVALTCPSVTILKGSSASASWAATDGGSGVAGTASGTIALNTSAVGLQTATFAAGSVQDNVGNGSAAANCSYSVIYAWSGFRQPIDNVPALNRVKAGSSIPVKFSLSGNQGLNIFAAGSPSSKQISCGTSSVVDDIEETVTAGGSSLSYDVSADQYNYVWKTDKAWVGTCRELKVTLNDGTSHTANFQFTK